MNLMMLLEMAASGFGDRVAVQQGERRLTYTELFNAAGAAADAYTASGCEQAALLDVSSPAVPVSLFGAAWAGVPFAPLNYRLTGDELQALLDRIKPAYLVTDDERAAALTTQDGVTAVATGEFLHSVAGGTDRSPEWSMDGDDIAILLFTSGTTGAPKAAVLRHKHLVSYILGSVEFGGAAEEDAALVSVPPYHIAGMAAIMSSVYSGRRIVQLPNFSAQAWIELARSEKITHAFVVPTMLARIVDELGEEEEDFDAEEEQWFEATEGRNTIESLIHHFDDHPEETPDGVVEELQAFDEILAHAEEHDVRWHFDMDL